MSFDRAPEKKSLLYWSAIDYYRWWLAGDQVELRRIRDNGGRHDAASVRRVAIAYKVNRGILRKDPDDTGAAELARLLNESKSGWPEGLGQRASHCVSLAKAAATGESGVRLTRGFLVSAMTKLMWFLLPERWTIYDELAATGLGIARMRSTERAPLFYEELCNRGFRDVCDKAAGIIRKSAFPDVMPERILDKHLMCTGIVNAGGEHPRIACMAFLEGLPQRHKTELIELASELEASLGSDPLKIER